MLEPWVDHPLSQAFEQIRRSVLAIEVKSGTEHWSGTGFVCGILSPSRRLIVATARHILEVSRDEPTYWIVREFNAFGFVTRECRFRSDPTCDAELPYSVHRECDTGLLWLPAKATDGTWFARGDEQPLAFLPSNRMFAEGTRVAWAGFSFAAEAIAGGPTLCYFEGVICAAINRADKHLYLVDGVAKPGVSGGPMWGFIPGNSNPMIAAVLSHFASEAGVPGFAVFEPLNHVLPFLKSSYRVADLRT